MNLKRIEGPEGTGDKNINLQNSLSLESLDLFINENNKETPLEDNITTIGDSKDIKTKKIGNQLTVSDVYCLAKADILKEKHLLFIGSGNEKLSIGPVLQTITRSTYSKVKANKFVHFIDNPIDNKGHFLFAKETEIAITPSNDEQNDFLIVISEKGCFIVKSGGFIVFEMPIVMVKSSGNYFTISSSKRNILILKKGVHLILYAKLEETVAIILSMGPKRISEVEEESEGNVELNDTEPPNKALLDPIIDVVKLEINENDLTNKEQIPQSIYLWLITNGYELEKGEKSILAKGPYSIVRRGKKYPESTPIAVKVIFSDVEEVNQRDGKPPQELFIAKKVNHNNIIKTLATFCAMSEGPRRRGTMFSFMIMEMATNDRLDTIIKKEGKFSETKAKQTFMQIISAVVYLHSNCIAHCYIRLDNCIAFEDNVIKLSDFSKAENISSNTADMKNNKFASLEYMPPEVFEPNKCDLFKVDIWMSACLLYSLLTANLSPFGKIYRTDHLENSDQFICFKTLQCSDISNDISVSDVGKDLLRQMFKIDPKERIDSKKVLAHQWIQ